MITLKTLEAATQQEIFEQVGNHLLTQNAKSVEGTNCLYLNRDGLKCAAGCLIGPDELPRIIARREADDVADVAWVTLVSENLVPNAHGQFIHDLQGIHDFHPPSAWKEQLILFAAKYELDATFLQNY